MRTFCRSLSTIAFALALTVLGLVTAQSNNAPVGSDNTVTTLENVPYTFTETDYGFSDPNDNPADNFSRVKITTVPSAGGLSISGNSVTAGDFVGIISSVGATSTSQPGSGVRFWLALDSSADGAKIIAGAGDHVYTSTDSGVTWTARITDQTRVFLSVASSADGSTLVAGSRLDYLFVSNDSGVTWAARASQRYWSGFFRGWNQVGRGGR